MKAGREDFLIRLIPGLALAGFWILLYTRFQQWSGEFGTAGTISCAIAISCVLLFATFGPEKWIKSRPTQNLEIAAAWAILSAFRFLMHRGFMEAYLFAGVAVVVTVTAIVQFRRERGRDAAKAEDPDPKTLPGRLAN